MMNTSEKISNSYNWESVNILIAEDEMHSFSLLSAYLRYTKANIMHAKTGKEAVEICMNKKVDLVLMDIQMPGLSGYDATMQIKEKNPHIYIIAQTACALPPDKRKALDAKCDDYIAKPIKRDVLLSLMAKYLNQ